MRSTRRAFTLVELLVVIAIIVVLLALLVPAMDKAIYQAELTACGANLHAVATSGVIYAAGNKRAYPYRYNVFARGWKPNVIQVSTDAATNERPIWIQTFGEINNLLNCPLLAKVDLENSTAESNIEVGYALWMGFKYFNNRGMLRQGDRWAYGNEDFNWIASDMDLVTIETVNPGSVISSHPDDAGMMSNFTIQDKGALAPVGPGYWSQYTLSRWQMLTGSNRGAIDKNYAAEDGSVKRFVKSTITDPDQARIPCTADPAQYTNVDQLVPRR